MTVVSISRLGLPRSCHSQHKLIPSLSCPISLLTNSFLITQINLVESSFQIYALISWFAASGEFLFGFLVYGSGCGVLRVVDGTFGDEHGVHHGGVLLLVFY